LTKFLAGRWTKLVVPPSFSGLSSHTVTGTGNGGALIVGGENGPRTLVPSEQALWRYQHGTLSRGDGGFAILGHSSVAVGNLVYTFGGRYGGTMGVGDDLAELWRFDSIWSQVDVLGRKPTPRSYHAAASRGSSIFVFGGCSDHDRLNDLWKFDTKEAQWEMLHAGGPEACPSPRGGSALVSTSDDRLYCLFGYSGTELHDCWRFDLVSRKWFQLPPALPGARSVFAHCFSAGEILVFAGEGTPSAQGHEGAGSFHRDLFSFNPSDEVWREIPQTGERPCARGWTEMSAVGETTILLVGGLSEGNVRLADAYLLDLV